LLRWHDHTHMRKKVLMVVAWIAGVTVAVLHGIHSHHFLSGWLPQPLADWLPVIYIAGFTIALSLHGAKQPVLVLNGVFAQGELPSGLEAGVFVTNVGEKPALEVTIGPLGESTFTMTFETLPLVNGGSDRKRVPLSFGKSVRDIFDVGLFLQSKSPATGNRAARGAAAHVSHPIRFTYTVPEGRTYVNEEYEFRLVDTWSTNPRYVIKKREQIGPAWALRRRIGTALENWGTRIAGGAKF
jgi:hypothetical protein